MIKNKNALSAIVALSMLLVVVVVGTVFFGDWFETYSSTKFVDIESSSKNAPIGTEIKDVVGNKVYFQNTGNDNITIQSVEVDGVDCSISESVAKGVVVLDLTSCLASSTNLAPNVVIYTNVGIFDKTLFIEKGVYVAPSYFTSTWDTTNTVGSETASNQIKLPLYNGGSYNFVVDWGDGNTDTITAWNDAAVTHTYDTPGIYNVEIDGEILGFRFNNLGDKTKITDIKKWGQLNLGTTDSYFQGCENLDISATDELNLTGTTSFYEMFHSAESLTSPDFSSWDTSSITNMQFMFVNNYVFNGDISSWDTSSVTTMNSMFQNNYVFNGDVSGWDTSSVTNMQYLFYNNYIFNQDLSSWNTSSVTNMAAMFDSAAAFNADISSWDTSSVTRMDSMFEQTDIFNQDISGWNTSSVTKMSYMFYLAQDFNQDISSWDVSSVDSSWSMFEQAYDFNQNLSSWDTSKMTNFNSMFKFANSFNGNISSWNVSSVVDMNNMFSGASSFNQDLSAWDVSSVTNMASMFSTASSFTSDLSNWDVSSVTNMGWLFFGASSFESDLSSWNVSSATNMHWTFRAATIFNSDLSNWDVSNVYSMNSMFKYARNFNSNLGSWDVSNVDYMDEMFLESNLSTENYSSILAGWGSLPSVQSSVTLGAGTIMYDITGLEGRNNLVNLDSWTITDGGTNIDYNNFITLWNTSALGISNSTQITLPLYSGGTYNFVVDWGDGTNDTITAWNDAAVTHDYSSSGNYIVELDGEISGFRFNGAGDELKLSHIYSWGTLNLGTGGDYFYGCENLDITAPNALNLTGTTDLSMAFHYTKSLTNPDFGNWDVSKVTSMSGMFRSSSVIDPNISGWDTSNVTNMNTLFYWAEDFIGDISEWNTSSVTQMGYMFDRAESFNADISGWDTSKVTDMRAMFYAVDSFNQDISGWDVSKVTDMWAMFRLTQSFDQDLGSWDVGNVTNFDQTFSYASMSTANYSSTLIGWDSLPSVKSGVTLRAEGIKYNSEAAAAWDSLNNSKGWTIIDDGPDFDPTKFITVWNTSALGVSASNQIKLPLDSNLGPYNFNVDWGDGTTSLVTSWSDADATHTYASEGVYQVNITGEIVGFRFNNGGDKLKLLDIEQWGSLNPGTHPAFGGYFWGCSNLDISAIDAPNLTSTIRVSDMFRDTTSLTSPDFSKWDLTDVDYMNNFFRDSNIVNPDLNSWDVSQVTSMSSMFYGASNFVGDISSWNPKSVSGISYMFYGATNFNSDISGWNVSSISSMSSMFNGASSFNADLSSWEISGLSATDSAFNGATSFNSDISSWDVSSVTTMTSMFYGATSFNQNLSSWNVSAVVTCGSFSTGATSWVLPQPSFTC